MSEPHAPMPLFPTILFATDFSGPARDAFGVACSLAREQATRLIVLHVDEPLALGELGVPVYSPGEDLSDSEVLLDQLRTHYVPDGLVSVEYLVTPGIPAAQILRAAEETCCDLLVMATQGRVGLSRLLMGSVAEAVMRRAPCACLGIRTASRAKERPDRTMGAMRSILHPTDFSPHSEAALQVARSLAGAHEARLVLVHVVPPEAMPAAVSKALVDLAIGCEGLREARDRVEGEDGDSKSPVESQLRRGDPAAEILDVAAGLPSDLIVMGSHGRTGLSRLLIGSVAESVLRGADCPVLMVKAPVHAEVSETTAAMPSRD
jgi:nucleotide-binding universal stress UspA family protein